jgi:molecular chaperone GrpE
MLTGPADGPEKATGDRVDAPREAVDWRTYVARLRAELEDAQAQASALKAELETWQAHAASLKAELKDGEKTVSELTVEAEGSKAQVDDLQAKVDAWKAEVARLRNREVDVRRQAEHRAESQVNEERNRLLSRLLVVGDNLERAMAHADGDDPLYAGLRLIFDDLLAQLKTEGVEPISALGNAFDPNLHEAVTTDGTGGHTVVKVLQTGYVRDGELVRPARVVVGSAPA